MSNSVTIKQGVPDTEETLALLNEAFGDWGDGDRLQWRYNEYPGYEETHTFHITVDGDLAAFRRIFEKEIVTSSQTNYDFFVLGDTCVSPDHRGEGLYSALHEETISVCKNQQKDFSCTFNLVGNITYEANLDRGWQYRTLPVRLRVLSPETVLPQYAQRALNEDSLAATLLDQYGHRIELSVADSCLSARDLLHNNDERSSSSGALTVPLPDSVVTTLVEVASSDDVLQPLRRRVKPTADPAVPDTITTSSHTPPFQTAFIEEIDEFYASFLADYNLHFRREQTDIEHMLIHPYLTAIITAERNGDLVGAAPICLDTNEGVLEVQVLDIATHTKTAFTALMNRIEILAGKNDADLIVAITDQDPGPTWATVDRQVMMWNEYETDTSPLLDESLHVGLYDVT